MAMIVSMKFVVAVPQTLAEPPRAAGNLSFMRGMCAAMRTACRNAALRVRASRGQRARARPR